MTKQEKIQLKRDNNTLRINILVDELKKYTPNFNPKSESDLRRVAAELSECITVDSKTGRIVVNKNKLNADSIQILSEIPAISLPAEEEEQQDAGLIEPDGKRNVLHKPNKTFGDQKYLILVSYFEKLSNMNKVWQIESNKHNQIFEEFDIFIEVTATLTSSSTPSRPIIWTFPFEEGQRLSGKTTLEDVCRFFAINTHAYGDKIIVTTQEKHLGKHKNVLFVPENAARAIQSRMRVRKYEKNHQEFQKIVDNMGSRFIKKAMINLDNVVYRVVGSEEPSNALKIQAWELPSHQRYELLIPESVYKNSGFSRSKKGGMEKTMEKIFKYLTFNNINRRHTLCLREDKLINKERD